MKGNETEQETETGRETGTKKGGGTAGDVVMSHPVSIFLFFTLNEKYEKFSSNVKMFEAQKTQLSYKILVLL